MSHSRLCLIFILACAPIDNRVQPAATTSSACQDTDGDGVCDSVDPCPLANPDDADEDEVCDDIDLCLGFNDWFDVDADGTPDGCDLCPQDDPDDTDADGICDADDQCPGFDDTLNADGDDAPDDCDPCPLDVDDDSDADQVCDSDDVCDGGDDSQDVDGDGMPNFCDPCPLDNPDDTDGDGVCDSDDRCPTDPLDLCPLADCINGSNTVSTSPGGDMVVCDDPNDSTCEEDFAQLCPLTWHLCTEPEFTQRNAGWNDTMAQTTVGAIHCRANTGCGHYTLFTSDPLDVDQSFNCSYGSSRATCTTTYGCNELTSFALCCRAQPLCGDGVMNHPEELCDDGNLDETDDCLNSCAWRQPGNQGISGC